MKTFEPTTMVPGQRRHDANGQFFWQKAKPVGHALHFRTEALKRMYKGDVQAALADQERGVRNPQGLGNRASNAPFVVKVPLYHGCNARVWGKILFDRRRQNERDRKRALIDRLKEMAGFGGDKAESVT